MYKKYIYTRKDIYSAYIKIGTSLLEIYHIQISLE